MDNSNFSQWTPLTGVYIATATLVCAIAIMGDLVEGLWSKQYWIPSGYSSLNSISLTILGAATKLSMDLSTTMPRHIDQLAKLGTSAFMCVALASIHPSLGKLENSELLSNIVALSILVISSIANLCIQLRTGVICTFKTAHVIILTLMSLLLFHCVLSAALLSLFKCISQNNYREQSRSAQKEWIDVDDNKHPQTKNLKEYLIRFSMLAHSGCPHFLLCRTFQGTPPMIYGLVAAIVFFVTQVTSIDHGDKLLASASGSSDISAYNWSVLWIFMTQNLALGVGTIVLCIRACYIAMVHLKGLGTPVWKVKFEKFWMRNDGLTAFLRSYFEVIEYTQHKSLVYRLITFLLFYIRSFYLSLLLYISVVVFGFIELFWRFIIFVCFSTKRRCITCKLPHSHSLSPTIQTRPNDLPSLEEEELSGQYISLVSGFENEGSVKWVMKSILHVTQKHMSAKERKTQHLEELLRQHLSPDFRGIVNFDSEEVAPLLDPQGSPPNCWSLPVVTLASIAVTLPNVDRDSIVKLIRGVNEGIVLAKLIEDKFNNQQQLSYLTCAAYEEWGKVFLFGFGTWIAANVNLEPAFRNKSPIEILQSIATSAEKNFRETDDNKPMAKLAAHSKYRLCKTILMEVEHRNDGGRIFEKLRATIADILGACLTNLKQYILTECSNSSSIEKRREAASSILKLFGDTEKIMEIIETREIPKMSWEKMVFIDSWREYYLHQRQVP